MSEGAEVDTVYLLRGRRLYDNWAECCTSYVFTRSYFHHHSFVRNSATCT